MFGSGAKLRRGGPSLLLHQPLIGWCQRIEHRQSETIEDYPVDNGGDQRGNEHHQRHHQRRADRDHEENHDGDHEGLPRSLHDKQTCSLRR